MLSIGRISHRSRRGLVGAIVLALIAALPAAAATDRPALHPHQGGPPGHPAVATPPSPARTDPALLQTTGDADVDVMVKLDYPPLGGRARPGSAEFRRQEAHAESVEQRFAAELRLRIPSARMGVAVRTVYGGVAVRLPGRDIADLGGLAGVVAVQRNPLRHTAAADVTARQVGAPSVWAALGGDRRAGAGIIVGVIDTGLWRRASVVRAPGRPARPPTRPTGPVAVRLRRQPRHPATGRVPRLPDHNRVGGAAFLETMRLYNRPSAGARNSDGQRHGRGRRRGGERGDRRHQLRPVVRDGLGVAPGASIVAYKAGDHHSLYTADVVAAIGQAVHDGVDVLNLSVGSASSDPSVDPIEVALHDVSRRRDLRRHLRRERRPGTGIDLLPGAVGDDGGAVGSTHRSSAASSCAAPTGPCSPSPA